MITEAIGVIRGLGSFELILDAPSCKGHTVCKNPDAIFLILPDSHTIGTLYVLENLVVLLKTSI